MPTYQFEAMDATGQEIRDVVEAPNPDEAQANRSPQTLLRQVTQCASHLMMMTQSPGFWRRYVRHAPVVTATDANRSQARARVWPAR